MMRAADPSYTASAVGSANYTIKATAPTFKPQLRNLRCAADGDAGYRLLDIGVCWR